MMPGTIPVILRLSLLVGVLAPMRAADASTPPGSLSGAPALVGGALSGAPDEDPRAQAYARGRHVLSVGEALEGLLVLSLVVAGGLGRCFEALASRTTASPNLKVAIVSLFLTAALYAGAFPLTLYGFLRERRFGFATQGFGAWLSDQGKGLLIGALLQAILVTVVYVAIRRLPRLWWLAGAGVGVLFVTFVLAIAPAVIAPLFNTFRPLRDADLRARILAMARTRRIPADEVYEMDASRQSRHTNAYVAGLLGTQRIVLYDTLLERFAPREIEFVMAHEMGHYVLHHIRRSILWATLAIVLGAFLVDRVARAAAARFPSLGIGSLEAPASLPLLVLIASVVIVLLTPLANAYSRGLEREADRFGLELTRDPLAAASSFVKFGRHDLGIFRVDPWVEAILYTHPSLGERIEAAREYARLHPEAPGARS
jgi:Zn-dependent protease with chaperone function